MIRGVSITQTSLLLAGQGGISFTPNGFKLSIMQIALSVTGSGGAPTMQQVLYTCPGASEEECLVDVTNQTELDAIAAQAASVDVATGVYDTITLDFCSPGKNGNTPAPGFVRGAFIVPSEGMAYVTDDDAGVTGLRGVNEDAGDAGAAFAAIGNWSCGQKSVTLPQALQVADGSATSLTVVVDAQFIANSTANVSPGMGGCRGNADGQGRGLCVNYPSMFAIVGGAPLIAYTRPYNTESSAAITQSLIADPTFGGPSYLSDTIVPSFHVVSDGTVSFVTGGSMDTYSAVFPAFALSDHKGVVDTRGDAGTWQYHAMPIP